MTEKLLNWEFKKTNVWVAATAIPNKTDQPTCYGFWLIKPTGSGRFAVEFPWNIDPILSTKSSNSGIFSSLYDAKEYCQSNENMLLNEQNPASALSRLKRAKENWIDWLQVYGANKFLESFLESVEGAQSICKHCGQQIHVDVLVGGGVPDWSTVDGDFGCGESPDTDEGGTGGHEPLRRIWQKTKWVKE